MTDHRSDDRCPIDSVQVHAYRVPLDAPESDGTLTWSATDVVVVECHAASATGLGFTYGPAATARLVHDVLVEEVVGVDALDPPEAWLRMVRAIRNVGRPGVASMAIAAVDTALWDLKARLLDQPLCRVLGMVRRSVDVYGSGGFTSMTIDDLTAQMQHWAHEMRIPRVKMKIGMHRGRDERRDLERIAAVREAIGDATALFVDANGAYDAKQAVRIGGALEGLDVRWFEEPVSSDDLAGLALIRQMIAIPVAAGEYGYHLAGFARMVAAGAVDVLQADVSRCAGITEWLRVAALAAAHGLDLSGHCAPSLHLHPACAIANLRHLELFADHVAVDRRFFEGTCDPRDGQLTPDLERAGNGLTFRRADAARFLVAP